MERQTRLFHMESAGSLTPALEGAACSARHESRAAVKQQVRPKSGADRKSEARLERR